MNDPRSGVTRGGPTRAGRVTGGQRGALPVGGEPRPRSCVDPEGGQISILLIGMLSVALTVVLAVVGVTSVQLSRIHLLDAADAAALDASDALVAERAYGSGIGSGVPLSDDSVREAAAAHLASRPLPGRVSAWALAPGTGSPDGRTAVVVLSGRAQIPVVSSVLGAFGAGVSITVTSTARSDLQP